MNNKLLLSVLVTAVIVGGGGFYGGMKYGQSNPVFSGKGGFGNISAEDMQARFQQRSGTAGGQKSTGTPKIGGGGMVMGEILSKDDKSITVKEQNGGSKIVFLGSSVTVNKTLIGSLGDLKAGDSVSIIGSANSDGSINAKSIQIQMK